MSWARQIGSTADLAFQVEAGALGFRELGLLQAAWIAGGVQDRDLFRILDRHQEGLDMSELIAELLRDPKRNEYWRKATLQFRNVSLFAPEGRVKREVERALRRRAVSVQASAFANPPPVSPGDATIRAAGAPSAPIAPLAVGWRRDSDDLSDAWKLYKAVRNFWPGAEAPGAEAPVEDFRTFQERYGSAEGKAQFLRELGELTLNTYLEWIWNIRDEDRKKVREHHETLRSALRSKKTLDQASWNYVLEKIPDWSFGKLGFDAREVLDYDTQGKGSRKMGPDLYQFRSLIVTLSSLTARSDARSDEAQEEINQRLVSGIGFTLGQITMPKTNILFRLPSEEPFQEKDFQGAFRLLKELLNEIFPPSSMPANIQEMAEAVAEDLYAVITDTTDFGVGTPEKVVSKNASDRLIEFTKKQSSPQALAFLLKETLAGQREGDFKRESQGMLRRILKLNFEMNQRKWGQTLDEAWVEATLKSESQGLPTPPRISLAFPYTLGWLNMHNNLKPFKLSNNGWTYSDFLQTESLDVTLEFVASMLALEKLRLGKNDCLRLLRHLFSKPDSQLRRFEKDIVFLKEALVKLEAKRKSVADNTPEGRLIDGVLEKLRRLRTLINDVTGFWPSAN